MKFKDVFGEEFYPGSVVMVVEDNVLSPKIYFGVAEKQSKYKGQTLKFIQTKNVHYFGPVDNAPNINPGNITHKFGPYLTNSYYGNKIEKKELIRIYYTDGADTQCKISPVMVNDRAQNIIKINNPIFNLDLNGAPELISLMSEGISSGYLPKGYKLGDEISFGNKKVRKGNAFLVKEKNEK